jgi:hypothetical protein
VNFFYHTKTDQVNSLQGFVLAIMKNESCEVYATSFSDEQEDASSRSRWIIMVQVQESSSKHAPI